MGVIEKLKTARRSGTDVRDFCLRTIRFRKLLENARSLLDLLEDGREKALGEFILDRRYVTTLIENVVEQLGMMVYDACVLIPEKSGDFFTHYDKQVLVARKLIGGEAVFTDRRNQNKEEDGPETMDPEYRLLADALKWISETTAPSALSVMDFMRQTFSQALLGLGEANKTALPAMDRLKAKKEPFYLVDLWKDAVAFPSIPRSIHEVECAPLKHLLLNASADLARRDRGAPGWIAATGQHQLSLDSIAPDLRLRLEATASGYKESDFVFIFAGKDLDLTRLLPPGFHVEKTGGGQLAWNTDGSPKIIEDSLIFIGRGLFNECPRRKGEE